MYRSLLLRHTSKVTVKQQQTFCSADITKASAVLSTKVVTTHKTKAYVAVDLQRHSFLTVALNRMNGHLQDPDALLPGKQPLVSINRMLAGQQSWSGRFKEEKNLLSLSGVELPTIPWSPST
jgi:hypothetical protein